MAGTRAAEHGAGNTDLGTALVKVFAHDKRRYGPRRPQVALRQKGQKAGLSCLRTAMRHRGLRALQPKAYTLRTTDSTHGLRCTPNRLLDQPAPMQANCVWMSDITYLPLTDGSWAYLRAFQDVASKYVVDWHVAAYMRKCLVTKALKRIFLVQPPTPELLVHSDRGGQYCGSAYRSLLHQHGAVHSQSRRGKCYDGGSFPA